MNYNTRICRIYLGENFYNSEKNIIRIATRFDKTDTEDLLFDVPLVSLGVYKNPDPRFHRVLAFFPEGIEKKNSIDNVDSPVGEGNITIPLGLLIDSQQYKKMMGSIGASAWNVDSDAGNQNIDDLDFFLPAGYSRLDINDLPEFEEDEDMKVCGIGGSKDGSIILRGPAGEISIGSKGIHITGKVSYAEASSDKTGILSEQNSIFALIPKTLVTPFPSRLPNIMKAISIAGIITSSTEFFSKVTK